MSPSRDLVLAHIRDTPTVQRVISRAKQCGSRRIIESRERTEVCSLRATPVTNPLVLWFFHTEYLLCHPKDVS